jgi:hypothetical protein
MQLNLFPEAMQKYHNAQLLYRGDSAADFSYAMALVACCTYESSYCGKAHWVVAELRQDYPESSQLLAWENQLTNSDVVKPVWRIKATLKNTNS